MKYDNLKVLTIKDFYFKLPDDFSGGLSDAFRLYADYHDEVKNTDKHENEGFNADDYNEEDMWNKFLDVVKEGRKTTGLLLISEFENDGTSDGRMKIMKDWDTK